VPLIASYTALFAPKKRFNLIDEQDRAAALVALSLIYKWSYLVPHLPGGAYPNQVSGFTLGACPCSFPYNQPKGKVWIIFELI